MSRVDHSPGLLDGLVTAQVSSRSLGLLRVLLALTIFFYFASPWVTHRMDDHAGTFIGVLVMFTAAGFVLFGYKTRVAAPVLALSFGLLHLVYGVGFGIETLAAAVQPFQLVVLIAVLPSGRSLSVDRALAVRAAKRDKTPAPPETIPWWYLDLFALQTAAVYLWAGFDMARSNWLSGAPIELFVIDLYGGSDSFVVDGHAIHSFARVLAWSMLAACLLFGLGLVWRRTRGYVAGVALLAMTLLMWTFSQPFSDSYYLITMLVALIACFPPQPIHDFFTLVGRDGAGPALMGPPKPAPASVTGRWSAGVALTLALVAFNVPVWRAQVQDAPRGLLAWDFRIYPHPDKPHGCDVRYFDMNHGGQALERWRVLGFESPMKMPDKRRRLTAKSLRQSNAEVCEALGPNAQVEVWARCGDADANWRQRANREVNVCKSKSQKAHKGAGR